MPPISMSFALRPTKPSSTTCPMMIPSVGTPSVPPSSASSATPAQTLSPLRKSRTDRDGCQSLPVMESLVWELAAMSELDGNGSRRRDSPSLRTNGSRQLSMDRYVRLAEEDGRVEKKRVHLASGIVYSPSRGEKCSIDSTCSGINDLSVCGGDGDDVSRSDERDRRRKAGDRKDCCGVSV